MTTVQAVKERPILFSDAMVRAILDNRKTQTRRMVKPQPFPSEHEEGRWLRSAGRNTYDLNQRREEITDKRTNVTTVREYNLPVAEWLMEKPYARVGDRLWVKEGWQVRGLAFGMKAKDTKVASRDAFHYRATDEGRWKEYWGGWRNPLFMPRWASRITLEVTEVRVERLQSITHRDCVAEGWPGASELLDPKDTTSHFAGASKGDCINATGDGDDGAIEWYADLWEKINGKGSWKLNPWVWVIGFKVIDSTSRDREREVVNGHGQD